MAFCDRDGISYEVACDRVSGGSVGEDGHDGDGAGNGDDGWIDEDRGRLFWCNMRFGPVKKIDNYKGEFVRIIIPRE